LYIISIAFFNSNFFPFNGHKDRSDIDFRRVFELVQSLAASFEKGKHYSTIKLTTYINTNEKENENPFTKSFLKLKFLHHIFDIF